jgi:fatty acid desaturase
VLPPDARKARRTWCRAGWVDWVFLWVFRVLLGWGAFGADLGVRWGLLWVLGLFFVGLFGFSFCGLALVVPVYTLGVLRGALRFL